MKTGMRDWVIGKLAEHTDVVNVEPIADQVVKISRKNAPPVNVLLIAANPVTADDFVDLVGAGPELHFVCNVPKGSIWTGDAIDRAKMSDMGWGGFGDLVSAINDETVTGFQKKEYAFVERGLRQHIRVSGFDRIYDRVFAVNRCGLPTLRVVLIYAYEMTVEHIRAARDTYGTFDIVLRTNPNGGPTQEAFHVGEELGVSILTFREFLSRLNR